MESQLKKKRMKDAVIVTNERGSKFEVAANGKSHEETYILLDCKKMNLL